MNCLEEEKDERTEDSIIKDIRNLFRLNKELKEIDDPATKDIRNLVSLKKENKAIKDRIVRGVRNFLKHEEKDYYKPVRVCNYWSKNYTECESNGDRNKTLSNE